MSASLPNAIPRTLPVRTQKLAKADLRKAQIVTDYRARLGSVIDRARQLVGWSHKELAAHLPNLDGTDRSPRQVAAWIEGRERPHWDVLFACDELQQPLIIALSELIGPGKVEIDTVLRMRRSA